MPMQPRPIAETTGPPLPNFRCFILNPLPSRRSVAVNFLFYGPDRAERATRLYLSEPVSRRAIFPPLPNFLYHACRKRPAFEQRGVLLPTLRIFGTHDC